MFKKSALSAICFACSAVALIVGFGNRAEGQNTPAKKNKGGRPGEIITPAAKGERIKTDLKVGDAAPAFSLPRLKADGEVHLSSFKDKKPVVLIFGSYT